MTRPHRHSGGFTIIELMVTVSLVAVLLGLAIPAFTDVIRNNRIANQTNAVVGALHYARGESATRGMPVSICARDATTRDATRPTCLQASATATNWANGWIIFTDRAGEIGELDSTSADNTDQILQTGAMPAAGFSVTSDATFVRFGVGTAGVTQRTFTIRPTDTSVCLAAGTRQIAVGLTGRVNSSKRSCS
jgi:type IV fimbrial biogenesis protein FimT